MPNQHASSLNYRSLRTKLLALEAAAAAIRAEGKILLNARIDSSKPGGTTVRGLPSTQYRLRVAGQKARYLKRGEVAQARAAIDRGRRLRRVERELRQVQAQFDRLAAKAVELGLELPK